jgi:hypothetical protein
MELKPVKSSNISAVGHDPETQELQVEFVGGGVYAYDAVPADIHEALMKAESVGKFFHAQIKNAYKTRKLK